MTVEQCHDSDELAASQTVPKPKIELSDPDGYYIPRELFAKRLINSPIEFGTLSIRQVDPDAETELNVEVGTTWEIDIAMHPHRGALICGMAPAGPEGPTQEDIVRRIDQMLEARRILMDEVDEQSWEGFTPPSIGLFVVAPGADDEELPEDWKEGSVRVCTDEGAGAMCEQMLETMAAAEEDADIRQCQRFVAWVRSLEAAAEYRSALELLLQFEEL